ncbi:hypothetical protein KSP40_PGU020903 [Platanthera guangdongensis]|uniref:Protein CHUP1, chloroplastic n=1 Tax=Platanthera guangdongensis TaxID=2320717 RepID=A0ABR2N2Q6_9ASPA
MREDIAFDNRTKPCRISQHTGLEDQWKNENPPKPKSSSSWGSHIVKAPTIQIYVRQDLKTIGSTVHARCVKRSLIGDFPCSTTVAQVHPHTFDCQRAQSLTSSDLFMELDHLRSLLRESKEKELVLQIELQNCKADPRISELQEDLHIKNLEIGSLNNRLGALEAEKATLSAQLASLSSILENQENSKPERCHNPAFDVSSELKPSFFRNLEMEVLELRRINKELQLQKRNLAIRLASTESQLASLSKSDIVAKVQAEASVLRVTNEDLCKQVEGLQMRRLNEVEELAYLQWVNSCLRHELCNSDKQSNQYLNLTDDLTLQSTNDGIDTNNADGICDSQNQVPLDCDVQIPYYPNETELVKIRASDVEKRSLRIPTPPPRPSSPVPNLENRDGTGPIPLLPPPPPPPPPKFLAKSSGIMQKAPQVAELYHSLMKRDSRKDNNGSGVCDAPDVANVRSSMIGEIENRSSYLLAIKADVETQGEFVNSLIKEVNSAVYQDIEDVVAFVKWLDDELGFLVDERAVLKHFDWPEKRADTLREAAFGYLDLKKLESEAASYEDDPRFLSFLRPRSMLGVIEDHKARLKNKRFLKNGRSKLHSVSLQIKFASVKLARKYLKRVAAELQAMGASDKGPALEYMLLQGVRFAFRIHQVSFNIKPATVNCLSPVSYDRFSCFTLQLMIDSNILGSVRNEDAQLTIYSYA